MNKKYWSKIDRYAKKMKSIKILGDECKCCGEDDFFKLEFHHLDSEQKEFNINELKTGRWSIIENELKKCILVCRNCHTEIHYDNESKTRSNINKKTFLNYKNIFKCEKCGYNKSNCSLDFHHKVDDKDFVLSQISIMFNNVQDLTDKIENEINKCEVLCKNCHRIEHSDIEFFEKNKNVIIEKSLNLKEKQAKINRIQVKNMYESGIKQVDIAKHFNAGKGSISGIIKELKLKK